eukprot:6352079-Amphidinium_carterae.1
MFSNFKSTASPKLQCLLCRDKEPTGIAEGPFVKELVFKPHLVTASLRVGSRMSDVPSVIRLVGH